MLCTYPMFSWFVFLVTCLFWVLDYPKMPRVHYVVQFSRLVRWVRFTDKVLFRKLVTFTRFLIRLLIVHRTMSITSQMKPWSLTDIQGHRRVDKAGCPS